VCSGGGVCCESLGYCAGWWWYGVFREGVGNERKVGAASKQHCHMRYEQEGLGWVRMRSFPTQLLHRFAVQHVTSAASRESAVCSVKTRQELTLSSDPEKPTRQEDAANRRTTPPLKYPGN